MSPPAAQAVARPTGSWNSGPGQTRDALINTAHLILANVGYAMSPTKVQRLVSTFERRVHGNGFSFFEFVANSVALSADQRRAELLNPDIARVIAYADPTGETAVNNAMRGKR
jgi:hypothetical protein